MICADNIEPMVGIYLVFKKKLQQDKLTNFSCAKLSKRTKYISRVAQNNYNLF